MKKYIVKQLLNDDDSIYYDSLKEDLINNFNESIFIGLNRDYRGINDDILQYIINNVLNYSNYDIEVYYKNNMAVYIIDTLKCYKKISLKQALNIIKVIKDNYYNNLSKYDAINSILSIIYCKAFNYRVLCDCCQSDWIYCFYTSDIKNSFIKYIEAVIWNTGAEVYISCDKIDIDNLSDDDIENIEFIYDGNYDYITGYNIKNAVMDQYGYNSDDIAVYEIESYTTITSYKIKYRKD